mmetsp:Transcript_11715/g.11631  ORF Transcript_11715/g.11631 Transcript_11715/m.11631 type:complete len:234 (-) Transcript_11715:868-1569(-)
MFNSDSHCSRRCFSREAIFCCSSHFFRHTSSLSSSPSTFISRFSSMSMWFLISASMTLISYSMSRASLSPIFSSFLILSSCSFLLSLTLAFRASSSCSFLFSCLNSSFILPSSWSSRSCFSESSFFSFSRSVPSLKFRLLQSSTEISFLYISSFLRSTCSLSSFSASSSFRISCFQISTSPAFSRSSNFCFCIRSFFLSSSSVIRANSSSRPPNFPSSFFTCSFNFSNRCLSL